MIIKLIRGIEKIIGFNYILDGKKKCLKCKEILSKNFFRKKNKIKDGLSCFCKKCDRK